MKYAITCLNNEVFQHFGKTPSFMLVCVEGEKVSKEILSTGDKGHGALAVLLQEQKVDVLVCGGIGQGARDALSKANIQLISGACGSIDEIITKLVDGTLKDDPSGVCNHHHEGEGHTCGSHDQCH